MAETAEKQLIDLLSDHRIESFSWIDVSGYPGPEQTKRTLEYNHWLELGNQGNMEYLVRHSHLKYHPELLVPGAKTLILMVFPYFQNPPVSTTGGEPSLDVRIARYAWGRDYHKVLKKKLKRIIGDLRDISEGETHRAFVDSGPLDERAFAEEAGLGHIGRNGLLIHPRYGSWLFIAEILTSLKVISSGKAAGKGYGEANRSPGDPGRFSECPDGCRTCIRACPTGALLPEGGFDARRCISYLTIEHKGTIPPDLRPLIGNRFFGCDQCQEVCPLNRQVKGTGEPDFLEHRAGTHKDLRTLLAVRTRADMEKLFAGSPLMRISPIQLLRNALVCAGNSENTDILPMVDKLTNHPDPLVLEHARWALTVLQNRSRI